MHSISTCCSFDLEYDDFNGIYTAIRNKEVTYGLLNADIAAYQQLDWNEGIPAEQHLAVIQVVPMAVSISAAINFDGEDDYLGCMMSNWKNVEVKMAKKYQKRVEV